MMSCPPAAQHLEFVCREALTAFHNGDLTAGIRSLGHAVYVAAKGDHELGELEVQRLVSTVTSAGAEAVKERS